MSKYKVLSLPLASITLDDRCRSRASLNAEVIAEYAECLRQGAEFPEVVVFFPPVVVHDDGTKSYWLSDGWLRHAAHLQAGRSAIEAEVRPGGFREARLHAAGSNVTHGLRRTIEDKRRALMMLMDDEQARDWPVKLIAEHVGVSVPTVTAWRKIYKEALDAEKGRAKLLEHGAPRGPHRQGKAPQGTSRDASVPRHPGEVADDERERDVQRITVPDRLLPQEEEDLDGLDADAGEDAAMTRERLYRSLRKAYRFARKLGLTLEEGIELWRVEDAERIAAWEEGRDLPKRKRGGEGQAEG